MRPIVLYLPEGEDEFSQFGKIFKLGQSHPGAKLYIERNEGEWFAIADNINDAVEAIGIKGGFDFDEEEGYDIELERVA
jgi:hypothetical protein